MVVRLGAMGDVIHALPAVAALRTAHPDATIGWVIEERWRELLCSSAEEKCGDGAVPRPNLARPLVDCVHTVNTFAWRKALFSSETWKEVSAAIRLIRTKYDVAVDFQGAWKSGLIAQLSAAPTRIGFSHPREAGVTLFYSKKVESTRPHVVEQNLQLAAAVGTASLADSTQLLPVGSKAEEWAETTLRQNSLDRFAIINPGAGWGAKCWPAESYAAVARGLHYLGLRSVVNFGPAEEPLAKAVVEGSAGAAVAIPFSISELIAITRRAALFVGGDTGPMHLAAALRVPVVGIFGPTDPTRNGPYGTRSVVLRGASSVTSYSHTSAADRAMLSITPADVLAAARQLIETSASGVTPNG